MTGRWVTMDWDGHCHLWAGSVPPQWDDEAGRWDCTDQDDLLRVRVTEELAERLARIQSLRSGDIAELLIHRISINNYTREYE